VSVKISHRIMPRQMRSAYRLQCIDSTSMRVAADNDALPREYRERLAERTGVTVCLAVLCEAPKRLKLRPKNLWTLRAAEQDRPEIAAEREAYRQQMSEIPAKRSVFRFATLRVWMKAE
jgi:hypothetical protein